MTDRGDGARRGRSLGLAAAILAGAILLASVLWDRSAAMTSGTVALSATLLVAGAGLSGVFLRRAGVGGPLSRTPGWRWLDPGAVLYLVAGLASFVVLFLLVDARGMPPGMREVGVMVGLVVPLASAWVLEPREVDG